MRDSETVLKKLADRLASAFPVKGEGVETTRVRNSRCLCEGGRKLFFLLPLFFLSLEWWWWWFLLFCIIERLAFSVLRTLPHSLALILLLFCLFVDLFASPPVSRLLYTYPPLRFHPSHFQTGLLNAHA
jgi:hypothetical protein